MRHLLFPGRCQPIPPPPTRAQRAKAWAQRAASSLRADAVESWHNLVGLGPLAIEPSFLAAAGILSAAPVLAPAGMAEPVTAFINLWWQLAIMVVAAVVSSALAPRPPTPKPHALADFDVPTAEEGRKVAKIFGEMIVPDPNVLWYGDLSSTAIRKKGGKK